MTKKFLTFRKSLAILLLMVVCVVWSPGLHAMDSEPATVLKAYLQAMYARDADAAYALVSRADKQEKSLSDYRSETGNFNGTALAIARALAREITLSNVTSDVDGERARISFDARIPDANHPDLDVIAEKFDRSRLNSLSEQEVDLRLAGLRQMVADNKLPAMRSLGESWELVREDGTWRVFLNWADAIEVRFDAVVIGDLGWEFEPVRKRVLVQPGETVEMAYRVRNTGNSETVGKARHVVGPVGDAGFMEIVSCFCFLEQALKPGEETELPLVFRVDFAAPETLRQLDVRYEFFPRAEFPEGAAG